MKRGDKMRIVDIIEKAKFEKQLYRCLAPLPFRRYRQRHEYLCRAIPTGFMKKLLIFNASIVSSGEFEVG